MRAARPASPAGPILACLNTNFGSLTLATFAEASWPRHQTHSFGSRSRAVSLMQAKFPAASGWHGAPTSAHPAERCPDVRLEAVEAGTRSEFEVGARQRLAAGGTDDSRDRVAPTRKVREQDWRPVRRGPAIAPGDDGE